ncbi:MAG: saccharopine dehydrogenase NADP-binding domain-containing protein [Actinomycetota bacterium]|nr:saccharopine dehydrogenase NADP-binding domain-containing protein [Actinomycetota bacterium]
MRAVILGAGGAIGRQVTAGLIDAPEFDQVVLADLVAVRARRGARVRTVSVDAGDAGSLRRVLAPGDLVVNCTSYRLGLKVLKVAIAARCDYLDLGGLYNTPRQLELHDRARRAGITAVIGCGATPGLSNVLVGSMAERLDEVHEVSISFASHRDPAPSPGLLDTLLDEFRPDVPRFTWKDGGLHAVGAFEGARRVRFPEPLGVQEVYYVPHSETYTLPRSFGQSVRDVAVRGTWRPSDMQRLRGLAELGLTSEHPVGIDGHRVRPIDVVRSVLLASPPRDPEGLWAFFLHVEVAGVREGRPVRITRRASHPLTWGTDSTARMTAVPAIIGARMIAGGPAGGPGVIPPERAFDPRAFLSAVRAMEVRVVR